MLRAVLRKAISAKIASCRMARKMIPLTVVKAGVFHGPKANFLWGCVDLDAQHDRVDEQLRSVGRECRDDAGDHGHGE